jgi:hypothetical protein
MQEHERLLEARTQLVLKRDSMWIFLSWNQIFNECDRNLYLDVVEAKLT